MYHHTTGRPNTTRRWAIPWTVAALTPAGVVDRGQAQGSTQSQPADTGLRAQTWLALLVPARLAVGYHFILVAWPKIFEGFPGDALAAQLLTLAPRNPVPLHRDFIVNIVVPNADVFAALITWGEVAIGLSLVAGCLVRVSTIFAAFQNLNLYLAIAIPSASPQVPWNRTLVFMHLVFCTTSAGRVFGIDGWLKRRFPRSPLF